MGILWTSAYFRKHLSSTMSTFWTKVLFVSVQPAVLEFSSAHLHCADNLVLERLHRKALNSLGNLQDLTGQSPTYCSLNSVWTLFWGGAWTKDKVLGAQSWWLPNDWFCRPPLGSSGSTVIIWVSCFCRTMSKVKSLLIDVTVYFGAKHFWDFKHFLMLTKKKEESSFGLSI